MSRLSFAIERIVFARNYTLRLLDRTEVADWFRQPPGGVTHIAWQVGHLAYAEYRTALERIRGVAAGDAELIPEAFQRLFGRESVPDPDPSHSPAPAELRAVFDRVHRRVLAELSGLSDADLDGPLPSPHPQARNRREMLLWCVRHEMLHAGQIGLLRRLLGNAPLW